MCLSEAKASFRDWVRCRSRTFAITLCWCISSSGKRPLFSGDLEFLAYLEEPDELDVCELGEKQHRLLEFWSRLSSSSAADLPARLTDFVL
ncbi:hypothetical protein BpHYR1_028004 [Brachionus plicatilis]|uniref:Uncharacterized protein n=1 Tax=Brachionus plicatilis TaxID=10195 RepID=A0A3M7RKS9_BRAPC|nr:hypothetical protein BpHYR1_028004 [Brachionus plicatilis]